MFFVNKDKRLKGFLDKLYLTNKSWANRFKYSEVKLRYRRCINSNIATARLNIIKTEEYSNASIIKSSR